MTGVYSGLQETVVPKASDRICVVCPRDLVTYVKKIRYRTAFVAALFDSIVGSMSTWGGGEVVGITSEDLVTYRGSLITALNVAPAVTNVFSLFHAYARKNNMWILDHELLTHRARCIMYMYVA